MFEITQHRVGVRRPGDGRITRTIFSLKFLCRLSTRCLSVTVRQGYVMNYWRFVSLTITEYLLSLIPNCPLCRCPLICCTTNCCCQSQLSSDSCSPHDIPRARESFSTPITGNEVGLHVLLVLVSQWGSVPPSLIIGLGCWQSGLLQKARDAASLASYSRPEMLPVWPLTVGLRCCQSGLLQ